MILAFILICAALYLFIAVNRSNANRREQRRQHFAEKQQELQELLKKKKDTGSVSGEGENTV